MAGGDVVVLEGMGVVEDGRTDVEGFEESVDVLGGSESMRDKVRMRGNHLFSLLVGLRKQRVG